MFLFSYPIQIQKLDIFQYFINFCVWFQFKQKYLRIKYKDFLVNSCLLDLWSCPGPLRPCSCRRSCNIWKLGNFNRFWIKKVRLGIIFECVWNQFIASNMLWTFGLTTNRLQLHLQLRIAWPGNHWCRCCWCSISWSWLRLVAMQQTNITSMSDF